MPTSTEVAGISIGISADLGGLDASLSTASRKVDNWARRTENRKVNVTVNAVKGESWNTIEREFESIISRVTQGQKVPVKLDFEVNQRSIHSLYENLYNTIRTEVGTRKIPIEVSYKAQVDVAVSWHWANGAPPGDLNVGVSGTPTGEPPQTTQGRRRTTSARGETVTPSPTQAPAEPQPVENFGQKMARLARERREAQSATAAPPPEAPKPQSRPQTGTAKARQQPTVAPTTASVEEVSGIAAMGTATPKTAAARAREAVIKANTEAHRAEIGATREWVKVTRARAREIAGESASFRRGASGFTAEMVEGAPTGQVKYRAGGQPFHFIPEGRRPMAGRGERQKFAPVPEHQQPTPRDKTAEDTLIEDILAIVSPEQGAALRGLGVVPTSLPKATRQKLQSRVNRAIAGQMERQERRASRTPTGVDWRSSRWFDSASEVDPAERRANEEAFIAEMQAEEEAEWSRLREIFGATDEDRERIIKNWAGKSERWGKLVSSFGKGGIENLAKTLGSVLTYTKTEGDRTLAEAAELVEQGQYTEAYEILRPTMQAARQEILSNARSGAVGAQRLARLRGEATRGGKNVLPQNEAETTYMAGAALQGRIRLGQEFARQDDRRAAGVEKAQETKAGKRAAAARAAYIEEYGPIPEAPQGLTPQQMAEREGGQPEDWESSEWREYKGRLQDFWADFRDFEKEWKPTPKAESKATGTGTTRKRRGQAVSGPADVPLSPRNVETSRAAERLGELQVAEEENLDFDPDEMANLVERLERTARGDDFFGSRRRLPSQDKRIARAQGLVDTSRAKLEGASDPARQSYYKRQLERNKRLLATAKKGTTAERGLTGEHRRLSEEVRANVGFCQYCGEPFMGKERGHADHAIPRAQGGGPETLTASCAACNELKGDQDFLSWLQDPKRRPLATVDPLQARAHQEERFPHRLWDRKLDLQGSRENTEGLPTEVPDVRDISEALGIGRGGFQAGRPRRVVSSGVLDKLRRQTKGADVEQAAYLVGESYVDEYGRQLDVITEAVMAEAEATADGFRTTDAAKERLVRRLRAGPNRRILGAYHGIEGHGLNLSTPENAALPELNDIDFLRERAAADPNFISMVGDPAAGGVAAFGVGATGDIGRRTVTPVRNPSAILRSAVQPVSRVDPITASAESPVSDDSLIQSAMRSWNDMTEDMRQRFVDALSTGGIPLPREAQDWANARERASAGVPDDGTLFGEVTGGALGPSPFRWNAMAQGAAIQPGVQPGPNIAAVNQRAAQMGVGFGGPGIPAGAGGGFGFGGGPAGPIIPMGGAPAGPAGNPGLNRGQFNRSYEAIRQDLLRSNVPEKQILAIEDQYETDFEQTMIRVNEAKTELQNRLGATPVRALSTAVGQFIAQRVARGPAQAAQRKANVLIRQQERAAAEQMRMGMKATATRDLLAQERATGINAQTGQPVTPDEIKNRQRELAFFRNRRNVSKAEVQGLQPQIDTAVKETAPLSLQLANLAALTPAIVLGGVIFQAAMAAAQAGLEALGKVATEGAEAGTGFNQTMRRVQDELAERAYERGDVREAVASRFQMAGFDATPEQRAALEGRAGAVVAINRMTEQRDLLRAMENLRLNAGPAAEFGVDAALVRPTGGFLGTAVGAQQSLDEIIGNELERLNPSGAAGAFNWLSETAPFTGTPFGDDFQLFGRTPAGEARAQAQQDFAANLNRELGQVGNNARFAVGDLGFGSAERSAQADALDAIGANEIAAAVRAGAYEIKDANGDIVTAQADLAQIVNDLGEALKMPSGAEFRAANERAMESALIGIQDQFRNAPTDARIGAFRNWAVNRPLPFGTGFNSGDAHSQAAMAAFGGGAQDAMAGIRMRAMRGRADAINLGVSADDLDRLEQYGTEIQNIRVDLANRQLEVSGKAYNQQLMVAKRNLGDIIGLTGQVVEGHEATDVGLMQQENLRLERQNTALGREINARGLDMAQRNINYNLAVSRFSGGGASGAERAARREQAEIEARFAQADLDDRRTMFDNEGRMIENNIQIVDDQNLRALQEALFAVQQIEEQHALDKYAAAAEQYMELIALERAGLEADVDAQIARGTAVRDLGLESARKEFEATGEYLLDVTDEIGAAFQSIQEDYEKWLSELELPGADNRGSGLTDRESEANRYYRAPSGGGASGEFASGGLFDTSGTYNMTVGEAGKETVAVLRNPRQMTWSGGGGGSINVTINNPVVRSDSDIQRIAQAVEEVLKQRSALLRPR